jgi:hypothetical protein
MIARQPQIVTFQVLMDVPPPLIPPLKGEGDGVAAVSPQSLNVGAGEHCPKSPSPLRGGGRGGGTFHMGLPRQ